MNPILNRQRSCRTLLKFVLISGITQPIQVSFAEQKVQLPVAGMTTVEELLNLESRAALENARKQVFGSAAGSSVASAPTEQPVLVAIYGTGRNLSAELLISGRTVIYHNKGKHSISGLSHGYALERISPPCVYLTKGQSQEIACLEMSAP